jgi:hypothetical protein
MTGDEFGQEDRHFTKSSIALAIIVAISTGAVAAEKRKNGLESQVPHITQPSAAPEGNRAGWFMGC